MAECMAGLEGPSPSEGASSTNKPTCIIVLGMAGSGKTTFVQRITSFLGEQKRPPYLVNLDPAVQVVPYPVNIDIRDTVNYKSIMSQYGLGPNGAIVTSLNLFTTRMDQVISFVDKQPPEIKYVIFDTPGQIEVFTWSASGSIIAESLASLFPTVIVYVIDTVRCVSPVTFMSNMLYACSILYKFQLPFIIVLNKTDIVDHKFAQEWMKDFEAFDKALDDDDSYSSNLTRSMSLVLDKFYENLTSVGVSSILGTGVDEFFKAVDSAREEFLVEYLKDVEALKKKRLDMELKRQEIELEKLRLEKKEKKDKKGKATQETTQSDSSKKEEETENQMS
ncbi:PREDICTED: GPN-loop GTPase 1-like [Amphimedon queenslandica]|uniref:GPN-loop GTPase n=1 Tax=Amphimedon queenslandica TaxID=400682 RepID=A0A1X7V150_AMPQE|nr:PREDICTED: GPN-loop GTPase 1-like [Amphimedon queenslandica]|eukprot:XP_003386051.1 PREDICTED: GPN-loop GTPase 1-like [Amphimedon queenslandica]